MKQVYYAVRMTSGRYLRCEQVSSTEIEIYSTDFVGNADLFEEQSAIEIVKAIKNGSDDCFEYYRPIGFEEDPIGIDKVTIEVERNWREV